jgi:Ca-activated chloride channel family protein
MRKRLALTLGLCLALAPAPALIADAVAPPPPEPPSTPAAEFEASVSVGYVLVPVVVRAQSGYENHLDAEDFRLLVDGRPAAIETFERRADAPASVVLLQDLSGSMANAGKLETSRKVVQYLLDHSQAGDEFAIATFAGDRTDVEVPFTADKEALGEAIAEWKPWGTTALHDAVAWVPDISVDSQNPKRYAVLITDGVDNASTIPPEKARDIVRTAQLPTYVIGLGSGNPYELRDDGKKIYRYADVLNLLALSTGGRYFSIQKPDDLDAALEIIREDVRHQYVIGFSTGDGASRFRTIRVDLKGNENRSRTVVFRKGYKGAPPAAPSRAAR